MRDREEADFSKKGHGDSNEADVDRAQEKESGKRGRSEGAQTFRRGRALHFLERLELRRDTLSAQLEEQAFDSIRPVIAGELKAVDGIIREFVQAFELHEFPEEGGRGPGGHRGHAHGRGRRHGVSERQGDSRPQDSQPEDGRPSPEPEQSGF